MHKRSSPSSRAWSCLESSTPRSTRGREEKGDENRRQNRSNPVGFVRWKSGGLCPLLPSGMCERVMRCGM
ncbi:unnamed protein product [Pylaiella littoralis]